jgi:hypothetical protein
MQVKAASGERPSFANNLEKKRGLAMPTETVIVVAALVLAFAIFTVSMIWGDIYTRKCRTPGARYFDGHGKEA